MSQDEAKAPDSKQKVPRIDLAEIAERLTRLASEFDDCVKLLRATPENPVLFSEMRSFLSEAGLLLSHLLQRGCVERPNPLPPWLKWQTRTGERRPFFRAYRGRPVHGSWWPRRSVRELIEVLASNQEGFDKATARKLNELDRAAFHRRHVFIEGVVGWLGDRCRPRLRVSAPTAQVVLETPASANRDVISSDPTLEIVVDWVGAPIVEQTLMFLDLGRASAAACRHLAKVAKLPSDAESVDARATTDLEQSASTHAPKPPDRGAPSKAASWPPPESAAVSWSSLSQIEKDQIMAFFRAGAGAEVEVPMLASKSRGMSKPNRHDYVSAKRLDSHGLTKKVGRTGRRLIALPTGFPYEQIP